MKELDKAIVNNDVGHIVFLLRENIDCKGAVFLHLKDQLTPRPFSAEELRKRGAILDLADLKLAMDDYLSESVYDYLHESYIKRLYLSLQHALSAWQHGRVSNDELLNVWDAQAVDYLTHRWISLELPESLQNYAKDKQERYIAFKYQQWQSKSLDVDESNTLDQVVLRALSQYWYMATDANDIVIKQIKENILDQTVEFYRSDKGGTDFATGIKFFITERIMQQIYDGSINEEIIKDVIEQEKDQLVKGGIVSNNMPYYKKAIPNLFAKWQSGNLDENTDYELTSYIKKQLRDYELPGKLKEILIEKAINQLLEQYKNIQLDAEISGRLDLQVECNITGYYDGNSRKESPFRRELSLLIFSDLLQDWKSQSLDQKDTEYLRGNLLPDIQDMLRELRFYTSRSALPLQLKLLQEELLGLKQMIEELKNEKKQAKEQVGEDKKTAESSPLTKVGMFREVDEQSQEDKVKAGDSPKPSVDGNPQVRSAWDKFKMI